MVASRGQTQSPDAPVAPAATDPALRDIRSKVMAGEHLSLDEGGLL